MEVGERITIESFPSVELSCDEMSFEAKVEL